MSQRSTMARFRLLFSIPLLFVAASAVAAPSNDVVARLQSFLRDVHSLKADFTQTVEHSTLPSAKQSHGTVLIKRPNRFRWNYVAPHKQVIDADGRRVWVYDAELEQVTVKPLKTTLASSPAMLLSGQGSLTDAFNIQPQARRDETDWVLLQPKTDDSQFKQIRVGLDAHGIRVMELTDNLGEVTRIEFSNVVRNPDIPDSAFRFTPPPGADVIGAPQSRSPSP